MEHCLYCSRQGNIVIDATVNILTKTSGIAERPFAVSGYSDRMHLLKTENPSESGPVYFESRWPSRW